VASTYGAVMSPDFEDLDVAARWGRVRARRWGSPSAPLVIGVPGLAGNVENLAYLAERIAGPDQQVVAVDLRGRGRSEATAPGTYGWERHAEDVFAVADALGVERFAIVGQSMGGSVAMKAAECDRSRLAAVVLVDVAGTIDPGIGPVITRSLARLGRRFDSADQYVARVREDGLVEPWNGSFERAFRYDLVEVEGGVRSGTDADAVAEDRAYTATQDPHDRWAHLTMPTLLVRAGRELVPGAGYVVPIRERDRFRRAVPHAQVVEVDANHLTVNTHRHLVAAVRPFLSGLGAPPGGSAPPITGTDPSGRR
jgi:pimeloyl-ACP methyl ester carboxylesterase